jgi:predicted nucleic acid-binding protein
MLYADSCYLVKYYCTEPGSIAVRELFTGEPVACLAIGRVELIATFHRKLRERAIDRHILAVLVRQFKEDDAVGLWTWLPVTPDLLDQVSAIFATLSPSIFLRTLDALHLAAAQSAGLKEIYSSDRHLLAAAPRFGLRGVDVATS